MKFCKFCKFSALLMMIFSIKVFCFETPRPTKNFYVNDFANVLTSETQEKIMQNSRFLVEKMQAQLVVATIVSLENMALQEYSIKLARDWKIGGESLNNGALILLAPNERKIRVEVGYGLEGALSDSKTKRLIESYAIPSLKKNDWNSGILNLYMAVYQEICKEYGIEVPSEIASLPNSNTLSVEDFIFVEHISIVGTLLTAFGLFFFAVIFFAVRRFRKRRRFRDIFFDSDNDDFHHHFFSGGGFSSSGGDGGFFGGGSSFSGGGGDFGGGGASGDF